MYVTNYTHTQGRGHRGMETKTEEKKPEDLDTAVLPPQCSGTTAPAVLPPLHGRYYRACAIPKPERHRERKMSVLPRVATAGAVLPLGGIRYYRLRGTTALGGRYYRYCGMCFPTSSPVSLPVVPLRGSDYK